MGNRRRRRMSKKRRSKGEKKCRYIDKTNIHDLNEDCLRYIFELLSVVDWLSVERTCKRWQQISVLLWRNNRKFDVSEKYFHTDSSSQIINFEILRRVLVKYIPHVTEVNLSVIPKKSQRIVFKPISNRDFSGAGQYETRELRRVASRFIEEMLQQCSEIEELSLDSKVFSLEHVDKFFLRRLLARNRKIRFLNLSYFDLVYCDPLLTETCANLETLIMLYCYSHIDFLDVKALSESKKLMHLCLWVDFVRGLADFCDSFQPSENLVQLSIDDIHWGPLLAIVPIRKLMNLRNLKILSVRNDVFGDDGIIVELCTHCKELMALDISMVNSLGNVTDVGLRHINASLKKLVCLKFSRIYNDDPEPTFTDEGLRNPNKNLKVFSVSDENFTGEGIIGFLRESENLEVLHLPWLEIQSEFIYSAIDVMKSRQSSNNMTPLKIGLNSIVKSMLEEIKYHCPLLEITTDSMEIDYSQFIRL